MSVNRWVVEVSNCWPLKCTNKPRKFKATRLAMAATRTEAQQFAQGWNALNPAGKFNKQAIVRPLRGRAA